MNASRICIASFGWLLGGSGLSAQVLGPPVDVAMPPSFAQAAALVVGDVNEDGVPDLVVAEIGQCHVLPGNGLGGFGPGATFAWYPVGVLLASRLHLLDWSGDGHLDLLVGHLQGATVLFGDGTGGFTTGPTLPNVRSNFAFADIDADAVPDFVGLRSSDQPVVSFGDGSGGWGALVDIGPIVVGGGAVMVGDVDRDGDADVVVQNQIGGAITTLLGDGAGGFGAPLASPVLPVPSLYSSTALVDVDGDQLLDVVSGAVGAGIGAVRVASGDGTGRFAVPTLLPGPGRNPVGFADFTADGHLDLVALGDQVIVLYPGAATGGFTLPLVTPVSPSALRLVAADFDADGRVDVVAAGSAVRRLRNELATPVGIAAYGSGTAACDGTIGSWGTPAPTIGEAAFRVACSNAPRGSIGLLAMGTRVSNGWDPLGIGLRLHLGIAFPVAVMRSDAGGAASVGLPIPGVPWLAGRKVHVQSFWLGDPGLGNTCSPAQYELASSRGLTITLHP